MSFLDKHRLLLAPLVLLAVMSCGKKRITNPGPSGHEVVFYGKSTRDTSYTHLFAVNADGSGLRQVTKDSTDDSYPRWSPDGTRIVFLRRYAGYDSANVTVTSADGLSIVRLTHDHGDANPSWSIDGTQIAYQASNEPIPLPLEVWVMSADGSNPHLLMGADSTGGCSGITWTPQGTLLGETFSGLLMQLSPTSTSLSRVAGAQVIPTCVPRLSPRGTRIAFEYLGYDGTEPDHIVTVQTDGSDWKDVTHGGQFSPVWSPDGSKLAYVGDGRVWVVNADGSNPRPITNTSAVRAMNVGDWR